MSCIIKRRINNTVYIIEQTSYRNKDGKVRTKQRSLGKLDADGVLISTKIKLPASIKEVRRVTTKFIMTDLETGQKISEYKKIKQE